jgi:hypothetical protein
VPVIVSATVIATATVTAIATATVTVTATLSWQGRRTGTSLRPTRKG